MQQPELQTGWLWKRSRRLKHWRRRFALLDVRTVCFYRHESNGSGKDLRASFELSPEWHAEPAPAAHRLLHAFAICRDEGPEHPHRVMVFLGADSASQAKHWIQMINVRCRGSAGFTPGLAPPMVPLLPASIEERRLTAPRHTAAPAPGDAPGEVDSAADDPSDSADYVSDDEDGSCFEWGGSREGGVRGHVEGAHVGATVRARAAPADPRARGGGREPMQFSEPMRFSDRFSNRSNLLEELRRLSKVASPSDDKWRLCACSPAVLARLGGPPSCRVWEQRRDERLNKQERLP